MNPRTCALVCFVAALGGLALTAAEGGGLRPGQRPGPYSAVVVTGPQRGQSYCFICETADRPAIIVFARNLSDPLGRLAQKIDRAVADNKQADLRSWVTFLNDDQSSFDAKVIQWGQKYALRNLPLGVFEDSGGPPVYRLPREMDVTVLLSVKQKVVANYTFRAGELNDDKIEEVVKTIPRLFAGEKAK